MSTTTRERNGDAVALSSKTFVYSVHPFQSIPLRSILSARVILPEPAPEQHQPVELDSDEEPVESGSIEDLGEGGDFLADFPDETEVCAPLFFRLSLHEL